MQHVSGGMLQELQQQGESEAEGQGGRPGAEAGGGGGVSSLPSPETGQTSFLFAGTGRSPPSQSTPPFFVASPGESPQAVFGRRRSGSGSLSEETVAIERSRSGSPASPASPWSSTSEALSPQLIGKRAEADASFLTQTPDPVDTYKSSRLASTTAHLRSLIDNLPTPVPLPATHISSPRESPPQSIRSKHSNKSIGSIPSISDGSSESSYAFGLRRRKPDLRLLKKRSKPSQHLIQKPSILKLPKDERRSPSFYKPKVIEDTGVVESTTKDIAPPPPPPSEKPMPLTLPELLRTEPGIKPIRKVKTLEIPVQRPDLLRDSSSKDSKSRPNLQLCLSAKGIKPGSQQRQLRFDSPPNLDTRSHEPLPTQSPIMPVKPTRLPMPSKASVVLPQQNLQSVPKRHYHDVTPPEDEPSVSGKSAFRHGDSYFHTFGADTMFNKEFVPPPPTPQAVEERKQKPEQLISSPDFRNQRDSDLPLPSLQQPDIAEPPARSPKKRNSSAFSNIFRLSAFKDINVFESPSRRKVRTASSPTPRKPSATTPTITPAATPGIMVSSPVDSNSTQRRPSIVPELTMSSYFSRPLIVRGDSQASLSPISPSLSPGAVPMTPRELFPRTAWEPVRRRRAQNRSSSEALSPLGTPRTRQRRYRESTLEDAHDVDDEASSVFAPSSAGSRSVRFNTGSSYGKSGSVLPSPGADEAFPGVRGVEDKPQEPSLRKKPSIWKGLAQGLRQYRSSATLEGDQSRESAIAAVARRSTLSLKASFSRVNLRTSISAINVRNGKLAKKSWIGHELREKSDDDNEPHPGGPEQAKPTEKPTRRITAADLEVTDFVQTPFSQRYYDTKRATQQAIRAFVDDTLEEDDDEDDDEVVLGFENDVPDHLPNSPLCPLHPKHKSRGKAICPLHGRYKKRKAPAVTDTAARSGNKMEIVFDTQEFGERSAKVRTASMGTDGAGNSSPEQLVVPIRKKRVSSRRKSKSRDSEPRGRKFERGECAWEARRRRAGKRRFR
ncbi:hypothetical protein AC578_10162 [Pseudocercospora eumusae]|uniref:Uncharacterized protein n=1 Tax=Pseudocercospora eumusae TaxID=321146 RepID=A0A139HYP2_9PEZI|nr:hypothetical protein AC578_10162 [Pseudocercospora eumusae]